MRVQPQEAHSLRAGLWLGHPQRRAQGPQLCPRASESDTDAAAEAHEREARTQRTPVSDQRAEKGDQPTEGVHEGNEGVESPDEGHRGPNGAGRDCPLVGDAATRTGHKMGRDDFDPG